MSMVGLGVLIHALGGNADVVAAVKQAIGKRIVAATMADDRLHLAVEDGMLSLWDGGQSCCENRYMTCDDDLAGYTGATIVDIELREGPETEDDDGWGGTHETAFLVVSTDRGSITTCTHNEHNGYYGGFWIEATWVAEEGT